MSKASKTLLSVLLFIYIGLLIFVLFFDYGRSDIALSLNDRLRLSVNLTPFHTIDNYILAVRNRRISPEIAAGNILGNLVLFLPMGYLLPRIFKGLRHFFATLPLILLFIAAVELLQLLLGRGSLDVDDVILNFTGAVCGYILFAATKNRCQ